MNSLSFVMHNFWWEVCSCAYDFSHNFPSVCIVTICPHYVQGYHLVTGFKQNNYNELWDMLFVSVPVCVVCNMLVFVVSGNMNLSFSSILEDFCVFFPTELFVSSPLSLLENLFLHMLECLILPWNFFLGLFICLLNV